MQIPHYSRKNIGWSINRTVQPKDKIASERFRILKNVVYHTADCQGVNNNGFLLNQLTLNSSDFKLIPNNFPTIFRLIYSIKCQQKVVGLDYTTSVSQCAHVSILTVQFKTNFTQRGSTTAEFWAKIRHKYSQKFHQTHRNPGWVFNKLICLYRFAWQLRQCGNIKVVTIEYIYRHVVFMRVTLVLARCGGHAWWHTDVWRP